MGKDQNNNPYAIASFIFGIISIVLFFFVGLLFGLLAINAGIKFNKLTKARGGELEGKPLVLAGIILGSIGTICQVFMLISDLIIARSYR